MLLHTTVDINSENGNYFFFDPSLFSKLIHRKPLSLYIVVKYLKLLYMFESRIFVVSGGTLPNFPKML